MMNTAYLGASDPNAALGMELSAIAAAVIGGTSLMGGRGTIVGAFIGVLIISVLQNGLAQLGVTEPFKRLITGVVIILAVLLDRWRSR
jgi:ribose transport system permease protein